jgi:hypothetical protein
VGFAIKEDFVDVVDQPLHLVDMSGFLPLYHEDHTNDQSCCHDIVEEGSSRSTTRTGNLVISTLSSSGAFCASSVQRKESDFFRIIYRGSPHSPS